MGLVEVRDDIGREEGKGVKGRGKQWHSSGGGGNVYAISGESYG